MTITTRDQLISALGNNSSRVVLDKASITNATAGAFHSLFRATGQPGQGAVPGAAAVCTNALTGAVQFNQQTDPAKSYLAWFNAVASNPATVVEVHDRLAHMGGLSGTVTTAQTVGIDIQSLEGSNNITARRGDSNYSDIQWWLEWYTDTGGTGVTATVNVTYSDGSTGNLSAISLAATRRASWMQPLNSYIPAAQSGLYIRAVNSVTLSATTGTAGSFGVTATRPRTLITLNIANKTEVADWAALGFPEIPNSACLMFIVIAGSTTTGTVRGGGKIIHG